MSLKPLMDRLKRTGAPTVEEGRIWPHWLFRSVGSHEWFVMSCSPAPPIGDHDSAWIVSKGWADGFRGEWRPVLSPAEQDALAALPGKVALESTLASIAAVESTRATDTDRDDCGECAGIHDGTLSDAVHAINAINLAAIVDECAK